MGGDLDMTDTLVDLNHNRSSNSNSLNRIPSPTHAQRRWLMRGLHQPGGKLPLFDDDGAKVNERTITSCLEHGWAEPWFKNPLKPDWLVCRLTETGRGIAQKSQTTLK